MPGLLADVDPDGLLEYSVVFTDRSLNHMSKTFQGVMNDISSTLKEVYAADAVVVVPGGGTYAMEAVARQLATQENVSGDTQRMVQLPLEPDLRAGNIPASTTVMKARPVEQGKHAAMAPAPIADVVATIETEKPDLVFAPHVETSSGMLLPDGYIRAVADAVHSVGGMLVLDCIASGAMWVDMQRNGRGYLDQRAAERLVGLSRAPAW